MAKARITTSKAQVAPSSTRASEDPAAFQAIDFMEKVRQDGRDPRSAARVQPTRKAYHAPVRSVRH
jgi:hypothetical protein